MNAPEHSNEITTPNTNEQFSDFERYYALAVLTFVYIFNFVDRQVLAILQEGIKVDLGLSDTQLGLLSGLSFALFYVTFGIPIARIADKGVRRNIVALAIGTWSFMTVLCGFTQNFWQLLAARVGVGIGEAGGSPPAHSMISDLFPPEQRATALSVYSTGINFGVLLGFVIGGLVNDLFGWRLVFFIVGVPGILLAFLVRFSLREPPRGMSENIQVTESAPPVREVFDILKSRKSFRHIALAAGLHAFVGYGILQWLASFMIRTYDLQGTAEIGLWLGLIYGLSGAIGTFFGGYLSDKLGKRDKRWYLWIPALATFVSVPFLLFVFLLDNYSLALWIYIIPSFCAAMYLGPTLAMTHGIVSSRMRALASAILFFVLNLIGMGMGPFLTGVLSDLLEPSYGDQSLRYALVCLVFVYIWSGAHYLIACKSLREDLANAPA